MRSLRSRSCPVAEVAAENLLAMPRLPYLLPGCLATALPRGASPAGADFSQPNSPRADRFSLSPCAQVVGLCFYVLQCSSFCPLTPRSWRRPEMTFFFFFFFGRAAKLHQAAPVPKAMSCETLTLGEKQGCEFFLRQRGRCLPGARSGGTYVPSSVPASAGKFSIESRQVRGNWLPLHQQHSSGGMGNLV